MAEWGASEWGQDAAEWEQSDPTQTSTSNPSVPNSADSLEAILNDRAKSSNQDSVTLSEKRKQLKVQEGAVEPRRTTKPQAHPLAIEVGFLDFPANLGELERHHFPSKLGGKPAWLIPEGLPTASDLQCPACSNRLNFLLQIYSPLEETQEAFHRTLYIFCCANGLCHETPGSIKVFRAQLPQNNPFYPNTPPQELEEQMVDSATPVPDTQDSDRDLADKLCGVCGQPATQRCAKCQRVRYCCREHQVFDWTAQHKNHCKQMQDTPDILCPRTVSVGSKHVFPQWELLIEDGPVVDKKQKKEDIAREMRELEKRGSGAAGEDEITGEDENDEIEQAGKRNKFFLKFQKRMISAPDQVLRYSVARNADAAIWPCPSPLPSLSLPPCPNCSKPRAFELQITPQLIHYLDQDETQPTAIDFGTLAVFTCSESCSAQAPSSGAYLEEFVLRIPPL